MVHKSQEKKIETYKTFFDQYPGMRYYISEGGIKKEEEVKLKEDDQES
jgi:hypothetical protein